MVFWLLMLSWRGEEEEGNNSKLEIVLPPATYTLFFPVVKDDGICAPPIRLKASESLK